jgi:alpha-tubulin suppressor-like RCC1 family protein
MRAGRKLGSVWLARWVLIPVAAALSLIGSAGPAGASSSPGVGAATLAGVVSVVGDSASGSFCALLSTGHIDCWGFNDYGQLGNGTTTNSDVPVAAIGITNAKAVTSDDDGGSYCALLSTGHVDCWGYNGFGELGNGTTTTYTLPVSVKNISTATAVIGSDYGFCARLSTGHVDCWGYGDDGELGNGTETSSDVPVAVHVITNAAAVIGGEYDFCALLSTGHLDCWGYNGSGELGNGTFSLSDVPVAVRTIGDATAVAGDSASGSFCALLSTGHIDCWGFNGSGELGNGTTTSSDVPVAAIGITSAKAVTSDDDGGSYCALLSTGHVDCWGYNGFGELGNGTTTTYTLPVPVKNISTARTVIGGDYAFCARLSTGHVDCWGDNGLGELGNGTETSSDVPVAVHVITNAAAVISGYNDFCALLSTSHVDCWGNNGSGELGNGTFKNSDVPVAVLAAS